MQFSFEDYTLDPDRRELSRRSTVIAVGPKVFDLLLHLVENRDRVVSKDDLLQAVWGGRIVSESTVTSHINAVRKAIGDTGDAQRLVRTVARKGFRFVGEVGEASNADDGNRADAIAVAGPGDPSQPVADKPSIAVLPFHNLSDDPEQEYFADGVVEDIITALSRIRWLLVIARNSSFVYKKQAVDVKEVGRALGVRYVLEGSMRKAGKKVRMTGQLIDATSGTHLWAERFEGSLDDIFELQDRITEEVVGAIAPQLEQAEIERAKRKPTGSLDAYDYYLRGMAKLHNGDRGSIEEALPLFYKAIALDPDYASAFAMAAWCYFWRKVNHWMSNPEREISEGVRLARRAVELGRDDAVALTRGGHALAHLAGEIDSGIALLDRALLLNPSLAPAWFLGGFLRAWNGETEGAIAHFEHAVRLSPLDAEMYRMEAGTAIVHFFAGRFDVAASWAERAALSLPSFLMANAILAASYAQAGRLGEARDAMARVRELDPSLRLSGIRDWLPIQREQDFAAFTEGLKLAGMPD